MNAVENGLLAAEFFSRAERALVNGAPFAWFFVRPPWAPNGACCKACVFKSMVDICSKSEVLYWAQDQPTSDKTSVYTLVHSPTKCSQAFAQPLGCSWLSFDKDQLGLYIRQSQLQPQLVTKIRRRGLGYMLSLTSRQRFGCFWCNYQTMQNSFWTT